MFELFALAVSSQIMHPVNMGMTIKRINRVKYLNS